MPETDTLIGSKEAAEILGDKSVRQFLRLIDKRGLTAATKLDGIRGAFLWNRNEIEAAASSPSSASPQERGEGELLHSPPDRREAS